jgi:hypothetical protein
VDANEKDTEPNGMGKDTNTETVTGTDSGTDTGADLDTYFDSCTDSKTVSDKVDQIISYGIVAFMTVSPEISMTLFQELISSSEDTFLVLKFEFEWSFGMSLEGDCHEVEVSPNLEL